MNRRQFLVSSGVKVAGLVAATSAFSALPAVPAAAATLEAAPEAPVRNLVATPGVNVTRLMMGEPGMYQVSGLVRLEAPTVEISGVANSKQLSWSGTGSQVVPFVSFEMHDDDDERSGLAPAISVRGGRLEQLTVTRIDYV